MPKPSTTSTIRITLIEATETELRAIVQVQEDDDAPLPENEALLEAVLEQAKDDAKREGHEPHCTCDASTIMRGRGPWYASFDRLERPGIRATAAVTAWK